MCLKKTRKPIHFSNGCRIKKTYYSGGKYLYACITYGFNFKMTPISPNIMHAWVSTAHWRTSSRTLGLDFEQFQRTYLSQIEMLITAQLNLHPLPKKVSSACSPNHRLFSNFLVSYESWVKKQSIHKVSPHNYIFCIRQPFLKGTAGSPIESYF